MEDRRERERGREREGGRGTGRGRKEEDTLDVTVLNCYANRVCGVHPSSKCVDA